MNAAPALLAMLAAFALGGCALMGPKPPPQSTYSITLERPAANPTAAPVPWQLLIEAPTAPTQLATTRIAVHAEDGSYGVLQGARWNEAAPDLLVTLLMQGFEQSGRIPGIGRSGDGLQADYLLLLELRAFEADFREAIPAASIEFSARLVRSQSRQVVASRQFRTREPAPGRGVDSVVQAFGRAASRIAPELVAWTLDSGDARAPEAR